MLNYGDSIALPLQLLVNVTALQQCMAGYVHTLATLPSTK